MKLGVVFNKVANSRDSCYPFYRKREPRVSTLDKRMVEDGRVFHSCSTVDLFLLLNDDNT